MTTVDELDDSFRVVMSAMRDRTNARADRDPRKMVSTRLILAYACREYNDRLRTADDETRAAHRRRATTLELTEVS